MSFLKLTPSMKTLVCSAGWASPEIVLRSGSDEIRMPGASVAKLRKLRSSCGRFSICCVVTLVAASWVRMSMACSPTTVIDSLITAVGAIAKVTFRFWPTSTLTVCVRSWKPCASTVMMYSPGVRPPSWKAPSGPAVLVLTNPEAVPTAVTVAPGSAVP